MSKILFVNACPRPDSRTLRLAKAVLEKMNGEPEELCLFEEGPAPLDYEALCLRDRLIEEGDFSHPMLRFAMQFREAEEIVLAAPYWDLLFPAVVRSYMEAVTASGLSFYYGEDGIPRGLCRAKRLLYVTTAGGPILRNFGYEYIDTLARGFFGIGETRCFCAEGLDIYGADPAAIMEEAIRNIRL